MAQFGFALLHFTASSTRWQHQLKASLCYRLLEKCLTGITPSSPKYLHQVSLFFSTREPINTADVNQTTPKERSCILNDTGSGPKCEHQLRKDENVWCSFLIGASWE
jgi:hypothetical protein